MENVKKVALIIGRILAVIVTLGWSERFIWVGEQTRARGGIRLGLFGTHMLTRDQKFIVFNRPLHTTKLAGNRIEEVDRHGFFDVRVMTAGRGGVKLHTWHRESVADFIESCVVAATA
jgi:hypothetical protein